MLLLTLGVRDNLITPRENFIEQLRLNDDMLEYLVEYIAEFVPENYRHFFKKNFTPLHGPMKTVEFREHLLDGLQKELVLRSAGQGVLSSDIIDGVLFSCRQCSPWKICMDWWKISLRKSKIYFLLIAKMFERPRSYY